MWQMLDSVVVKCHSCPMDEKGAGAIDKAIMHQEATGHSWSFYFTDMHKNEGFSIGYGRKT